MKKLDRILVGHDLHVGGDVRVSYRSAAEEKPRSLQVRPYGLPMPRLSAPS